MMFSIRNSKVDMFKKSGEIRNKVTIISAKLEDQEYETLIHLGRGRMFRDPSVYALKYKLNESIDCFLWLY